jgi:hypothetical protein
MPKHLRRAEIFKGAWPHATCAMPCRATALVHERWRLMKAGSSGLARRGWSV